LRDLLDGVRRRLYHLLAQLPVLVARPRRSLAFLVLPVVSLVAEDVSCPLLPALDILLTHCL
jgi:hypothetical protein